MSQLLETSINERVNSQLYSDVISSYVDINAITAQRNIVPGSYKESVTQCTDQTLATLNSAGGQTLFTRLKLTPQIRNATLAQLAQIYFQYVIPGGSLGVIVKKYDTHTQKESIADTSDDLRDHALNDQLHFKLFYDSGFSIASMVQLCLTADAKVSTENFNYQQTLLTLNSLPDFVTENSSSECTLKGLVENPTYRGVGSGLVIVSLDADNSAAHYGIPITQPIGIEGVIDLNKGNPLFHNFPIITRNMGELYIRLYMENFLRELKVVYLDKHRAHKFTLANGSSGQPNTVSDLQPQECLPYQRLPIDKPDFVYLKGELYKVKLVNIKTNSWDTTQAISFQQTNPIFTLPNIEWKRFEIRKIEFDVEEFDDIKASQAKAGMYKFPVHIFRSKNFDQTNAASSSANALQTTLNAPNIDRLFITQPLSRDYYTFLPTPATTDINPQLHNNPVLPRTEDALNSRTVERLGSVFIDTDKYSISADLLNSLNIPTYSKQLWIKSANTYGGQSAFEYVQRGMTVPNEQVMVPNKFAYGLELNAGGCFRRGFNSVIDGNYSPTVPINLQQSLQTSANLYFDNGVAHNQHTFDTAGEQDAIVNTSKGFGAAVSYGDLTASGAVASVHCLCDYVFWISFDQFGNMTDFGVSEYNDRA